MTKNNKKNREYFFSGSCKDRLPAILYCCMILSFWIQVIIKEPLENLFNIKINIIISFIVWIAITYALYKLCNKIMAYIVKRKENKV